MDLPYYEIMDVTSIHCSSSEEQLLKEAVAQKLAQQLLNPHSVADLAEILNSDPATAIQTLIQRIREFSSGIYSSMKQIGINVVPDGDMVNQLCDGLGLRRPQAHRVNIAALTAHNPQTVLNSCMRELFYIYIQCIGEARPNEWTLLGVEQSTSFAQRAATMLSTLQEHRLIRKLIVSINQQTQTSLQISEGVFSTKYSEELGKRIFLIFDARPESWSQLFSMQAMPPATIDGESLTIYQTQATIILRTARLYCRYILYSHHSRFEWDLWYTRLEQITNDFASTYEEVAEELAPDIRTVLCLDLALLLCLSTNEWRPPPLSQESLEEFSQEGIRRPLISGLRILNSLLLEDVDNMQEYQEVTYPDIIN